MVTLKVKQTIQCFTKHSNNGGISILIVYVDIIVTSNGVIEMEILK